MDFAEQNQLSPALSLGHWYYQAKFALLRRTLASVPGLASRATLADLGCGLGLFLTLLEKGGILPAGRMVGIDPAAREGQRALGGSVPILTAWPDFSFDVILLMDVLEHIEDDAAALRQAWDKLAPGGFLFITVPAFSWLWSNHDVALGHHRRYTVASLRRLLRTLPGLEIKRLHYFYALILPIAALVRFARRNATDTSSDLKPAAPLVNTLLKRALGMEAVFACLNKIAGLSVVAFGQKPA